MAWQRLELPGGSIRLRARRGLIPGSKDQARCGFLETWVFGQQAEGQPQPGPLEAELKPLVEKANGLPVGGERARLVRVPGSGQLEPVRIPCGPKALLPRNVSGGQKRGHPRCDCLLTSFPNLRILSREVTTQDPAGGEVALIDGLVNSTWLSGQAAPPPRPRAAPPVRRAASRRRG